MLTKKNKVGIAILIVLVVTLGALAPSFMYGEGAKKPFTLSYGSIRKSIEKPILVSTDNKKLLPACACFAPLGADGKSYYLPIFFSDNMELPKHIANEYEYTSMPISSFGSNLDEVSIKIAESFWSKIEMTVIVSNYDEALKVAPLAAWLNAPIVFKGAGVKSFLERNHIGNAIVVGPGDYDVGIERLGSTKDIWNFYLELLKEKGYACNYIVVTNPADIEKNVMVPCLSINSAILAAYRKAVVITGDYAVEKELAFKLGYGLGECGCGERGEDPDTINEDAEADVQRTINSKAIKVDNDIDYAVKFLKDKAFNAEYLGLVGSPDSVPMIYIKNPTWYEDANDGDNGEEYLATDSYYGDIGLKLDATKNVVGEYICVGDAGNYRGSNYEYNKPEIYTQELAVGRIVACNVLDAGALIARSFGYNGSSYTPLQDYNSILTSRACGTASPGAAENQANVFRGNGILSTRLLWVPSSYLGFWAPKDISSSYIVNDPAGMTKADFIVYDGHGYPDGWYYWWVHMDEGAAEGKDTIRTEVVQNLPLKPTVVFSAACLCSALDWPATWNGSADERSYADLGPDMFFSLALLHAGALAHIGSTEESWGAFFGGTLTGYYGDFDLATIYFKELLDNDLTIGKAHSSAKQKYYSQYNTAIDKTCFLENVLYGEPAASP